jgi:hypothetical protein
MKALIVAIGLLLIGSVAMAQIPDTIIVVDDDFTQGFMVSCQDSFQMKGTLLAGPVPPDSAIWYVNFGPVSDSLILTSTIPNMASYNAQNVYNGTFPDNSPYLIEFFPYRWVEGIMMNGAQSDVFYMDVTIEPIIINIVPIADP